MDLASQLQHQVRVVVERRVPLVALREWLDAHAHDVEASDDERVGELSENAWILFAELDRGHRSEEDVRSELERLLAPRPEEARRAPA